MHSVFILYLMHYMESRNVSSPWFALQPAGRGPLSHSQRKVCSLAAAETLPANTRIRILLDSIIIIQSNRSGKANKQEKKAKISKDLNATQISASDILAVTSCASALEAWCMSLEV
jgi:hypothetical protein